MERDSAPSAAGSSGDDGGRETYTARYDWGTTDSPSLSIVRAVAAVTGRDPMRMGPLFDVVNPTAVDRLFARDRARARPDRLSFRFENCDVAVHADGRVAVTPLE